jgi:tetratricopeptide (TPR) repeat protein
MTWRGEDTEARQLFEKALELNPHDAETLMSYARGLARLREFDRAWEAAQEAALIDPLNPDTHQAMAEVLGRSGRHDEAIELVTTALQNWPRNLKLLSGLRSSYFYSGDFGKGLDVADEISEIDPENFANWQAIFEIYMDLGASVEAQQALDRMSELAPERAYDEAAVLELLKGNVQGYQHYLRLYNETRTWSRDYRMIQLAASEQRYDDALTLLDERVTDEVSREQWGWRILQAAMAFMANQPELHAAALARADQIFERLDILSVQEWFLPLIKAQRAAAEGDAKTAVAQLRQALENGFNNVSSLISGDDLIWLPIWETPELIELIAEIQERNQATLEKIRTRHQNAAALPGS